MNLRTKCTSCKKLIYFKESVATRPDLEMKKGETFMLNCEECGSNQNTHINDVEAVEDLRYLVMALVIGVLIAAVLFFLLGAIGTIVIIVPLLIWQGQVKKVHAFNIYKRPRRS